MAVNRSLVQQIDALRLRVQVDTRHHDNTRAELERESDQKLKVKKSEPDRPLVFPIQDPKTKEFWH